MSSEEVISGDRSSGGALPTEAAVEANNTEVGDRGLTTLLLTVLNRYCNFCNSIQAKPKTESRPETTLLSGMAKRTSRLQPITGDSFHPLYFDLDEED